MFLISNKIASLKINRKTLLIFSLFFIMLQKFFIDKFSFPTFISYIGDFLILIILLLLIMRFKVDKMRLPISLSLILILITLICFVSTLLSKNSIFIKIWGVKNFFRYFIFFIACLKWLNKKDISIIFKAFFVLQIFNLVEGLYQYSILGYHMDLMGGIFGYGNGAILNVFQVVLCSYFLLRYLNQKKDFISLLFSLISSFIIAGIAEEKAFFIYLITAFFIILCISRKSFKVFFVSLIAFGTFFLGIYVLSETNESWNIDVLFNIDKMIYYAENSYGLSRINPFKDINDIIFKNDLKSVLLGLGMGSSYVSNTSILQTNLLINYEYLQYYNFTHSSIYVDIGAFGYILYISFFIALLFFYLKKLINKKYDIFLSLAIITILISLISIYFSRSLVCNEAGFLYFAISIGFTSIKNISGDALYENI